MRKLLAPTLLWLIGGWAVFTVYIQYPQTLNFDEFHYVPAARLILDHGGYPNSEHPPLAKWCIAAGIALGGDQPFGWRLASTVAGAVTLAAFFLLGTLFLGSPAGGHFAATLAFANQLLYVQSRIAMLDPIMMGFLSVAWVCFFWSLYRQARPALWIATGIAYGLACACKWAALIPCLLSIPLLWAHRPARARALRSAFLLLGGAGVTYFLVYLPLLEGNVVTDFLRLQSEAYAAQLRVGTDHPYRSPWWSWPLMLRPIWYAFDRESSGAYVRGVLLIGNPLILWSGLVALGYALKRSRSGDSRALSLSILFWGQFLSWAIIPRPLTFYYYYVPCGMVLTLALAWAIEALRPKLKLAASLASLALFAYFWPILAAWKIPSQAFVAWMWFRSWI